VRLIVGLGNPGKEYENTRHNIGFRVIDALSDKWGIRLSRHRCLSLVGEKKLSSVTYRKGLERITGASNRSSSKETIVLAKPLTFVNGSGRAVKALIDWLKIGREEILIIYDDFDLERGKLRLRKSGSSGGHKGLESIIESLGWKEFPRLRLGIGKPEECLAPAEYVLQDFGEEEENLVKEMVARASSAVETIIREGLDIAMSKKW